VFADRPGHSHGGLLILKLRPFVGFKIMIGTDWVYMTFANVQKLPTVEGTKSPNGPARGRPLRQRMRAALKLLFGPVTGGGCNSA
jgi:hypothetical protein